MFISLAYFLAVYNHLGRPTIFLTVFISGNSSSWHSSVWQSTPLQSSWDLLYTIIISKIQKKILWGSLLATFLVGSASFGNHLGWHFSSSRLEPCLSSRWTLVTRLLPKPRTGMQRLPLHISHK